MKFNLLILSIVVDGQILNQVQPAAGLGAVPIPQLPIQPVAGLGGVPLSQVPIQPGAGLGAVPFSQTPIQPSLGSGVVPGQQVQAPGEKTHGHFGKNTNGVQG